MVLTSTWPNLQAWYAAAAEWSRRRGHTDVPVESLAACIPDALDEVSYQLVFGGAPPPFSLLRRRIYRAAAKCLAVPNVTRLSCSASGVTDSSVIEAWSRQLPAEPTLLKGRQIGPERQRESPTAFALVFGALLELPRFRAVLRKAGLRPKGQSPIDYPYRLRTSSNWIHARADEVFQPTLWRSSDPYLRAWARAALAAARHANSESATVQSFAITAIDYTWIGNRIHRKMRAAGRHVPETQLALKLGSGCITIRRPLRQLDAHAARLLPACAARLRTTARMPLSGEWVFWSECSRLPQYWNVLIDLGVGQDQIEEAMAQTDPDAAQLRSATFDSKLRPFFDDLMSGSWPGV